MEILDRLRCSQSRILSERHAFNVDPTWRSSTRLHLRLSGPRPTFVSLDVEIAYTNSRRDQIAHVELLRRVYAPRLAFYHYGWVLYWAVMAGLGVYVSLTIGAVFIAAIFVAMFLFYAVRAIPYSRVWRWSAEQTTRGSATKQIRLRLDDQGLHETVEGAVESFAPWSAVQSFALVGEYLLIELAGDLWANVPRTTIAQGDSAFEEVVALLRSRGIAQMAV